VVQVSLGKKQDPIFKMTRAKRTAEVAETIENLPHKHEALSSNPSTAETKT
jgi:hypothetical protein